MDSGTKERCCSYGACSQEGGLRTEELFGAGNEGGREGAGGGRPNGGRGRERAGDEERAAELKGQNCMSRAMATEAPKHGTCEAADGHHTDINLFPYGWDLKFSLPQKLAWSAFSFVLERCRQTHDIMTRLPLIFMGLGAREPAPRPPLFEALDAPFLL